MKKIKRVMLAVLLVIITLLGCGCGVTNGTSMTEEGKGTVSFKIGFKKGSIEDTEYTRFDSIDDLAAKLQDIIDEETGLKVTTDITSSEKDDYIVVSYDYDNLEDYKANISTVLQKYNMLVVSDDINGGMFGYNPFDMNATNEWECEALAEYLKEQGIDADSKERNVRKFIKLLMKQMYICEEEYLYEQEDDFETDEESYMDVEMRKSESSFVIQPDVEIIEQSGEKYLKIKSMAMYYIEMYVRKLLEKNQDVIFDTEYVKQSSYAINGQETKEIFKKSFAKMDLAHDIKKVLDEKNGKTCNKYSMKEFSPVLIVKFLDDEYVKLLRKEYNIEHDAYQELKSEDEYSMGVDVVEELYNERDTKYEMSFGKNTAIVDSENMYDYMDEDSYFTLSAKYGAGLEVKNHNNVAYEDLDEAPESGDKENLIIFVIIAIIMLIVMVVVAINIIKQWVVNDKK